jgi:hypothetical protein
VRPMTIALVLALSLVPAACGPEYSGAPIVIRPPNTAVPPSASQPQDNGSIPPITGNVPRSCPQTALRC